jgi:hypothetical protein
MNLDLSGDILQNQLIEQKTSLYREKDIFGGLSWMTIIHKEQFSLISSVHRYHGYVWNPVKCTVT